MTRALVIGGGVAGPVAAMALQRAGVEAVVYEAYDASAGLAAGAWLTVAVNGLDALRAIDAQKPVLEVGFPSSHIQFFNGRGRSLGTVPIGGTLPDGTQTHTMKRADLYRALNDEAVRRGIRIEHRKRLVDASPHPDGVEARFADGTRASGDFLVGADGIHSRTRHVIDPQAPKPRYTGMGNIGGFTSDTSGALAPGTYAMMFGTRGFFGYTVAPDGEVWWFANPPSARELTSEELAAATTEDWKRRLIGLFGDDAGPAVTLIEATPGPLLGTNQSDLPKVPVWHRDRMVIIGDAAHAVAPSSGQGVSMAAEDAVTLARCVRDLPEPEHAFQAYERERRARVERVVAYGARTSSQKVPGPVGRVVRDLMLPLFLKRAAGKGAKSMTWLFDRHIDWDAPIAAVEPA